MNPNANLFYSLLLFISGSISLIVMGVAWRRRHVVSCARSIAVFSLSNALWGLFYALHWANIPRFSEFFWLDMTYFGVVLNPLAFLLFALYYVGSIRFFRKSRLFLLSIVPVLTLIFLWTDPLWGIFFAGKRLSGTSMIYSGGFGFWLYVIWAYSLIFISILTILKALIRYPKKYRDQMAMILLGVSFPVLANLLSFSNIFPFPNLDMTSIAFSLTGLFFALAILRYDFLDLMPISRDVLFETHRDAIFILDTQSRIVDANQRSREIFEPEGISPIGRRFDDLRRYFPEVPTPSFSLKEEQFDFSFFEGQRYFFEMDILPLNKKRRALKGYILTISDVTTKKKAELQVLDANEQLKKQLKEIAQLQEKLREESIRDHLTGLYNRRYLHEILSHAIPKAKRENSKIIFALFDLDHFKQVNDRYGHAIGDEVLICFSKMLMESARQEDTICRFGGEEFLVVFPSASGFDVSQRVDKWRQTFQEKAVKFGEIEVKVTFSAGIASFPEDGNEMDELFIVADRRLYLAKELGRDRVYGWRNVPEA